jgi:hypothetical protein
MPLPARFDAELMEPPAVTDAVDVDAGLLARVRAWCEADAWPRLEAPLRAASIDPHHGLDAVAGAMDGSHLLAALGRWRGLAFRLALLLRERLPGRCGRAEDPWDCGWWRAGPLAIAAAFRPRRATLLLVREADRGRGAELLATLQAASRDYRRPLRVLVVAAAPTAELPRP